MKHRFVSTLVLATSLLGAPLAAFAEPAPVAMQSSSSSTAAASDAVRYAQAETKSPETAKFEGGGGGIYIGGSAVAILLIILIIVIVL